MNSFQKSQSLKILSMYNNVEEILDDIEKAHPAGTINKYGYKKQADGSWKYVGKGAGKKVDDSKNSLQGTKSGNSHSGEFKDYTDQELSQLINNLSNPTKEVSRDDEKLNRAKIAFSSRVQAKKGTVSTDDKHKVSKEGGGNKSAPLTTAQASTVGKVITSVLRKSAHGLARDKVTLYDRSVLNKKIKTHLGEKSLLGVYIHAFEKDGSEIKYTGHQTFGTYRGDEPGKYENTSFTSDTGRERISMKEYGGIGKFLKDHPGIAAGIAENLASALRDAIEGRAEAQKRSDAFKYGAMRRYSDVISDIVPGNLSSQETLEVLEEVANSGHSIEGKTVSGHSMHDLDHSS